MNEFEFHGQQMDLIQRELRRSFPAPEMTQYKCKICEAYLAKDLNGNLYCPIHNFEFGKVEPGKED